MGELSIKIRIADRDYPMKVNADDQDKVRTAGKFVNDKVKSFKNQFGVENYQDLLAMVAFDAEVNKINSIDSVELSNSDAELKAKIIALDKIVSEALMD